MRIPKEKLNEPCAMVFGGDADDGGRQCEEQAEILLPFLGGLAGHAMCLGCAALVAGELQKDLGLTLAR